MSRADLVRGSGLSRTTVSSLVDRPDPQRPRRRDRRPRSSAQGRQRPPAAAGRPERARGWRRRASTSATVTSGWRSPTGPAGSHAEDHTFVDVDAHGTQVLDRAAAMVRGLLAAAGLDAGHLQAVGMCVPAPLDRRSSRIRTDIMPGWRDLLPGDELERRLGVPVHADNDANLGALAELHHGVARGRARRRLPQDGQRAGRRHRPRRPPAPRRDRHRRRDRPRPGRRGRPGLPVRQPRLPRDRWSPRPGC